MNRQFAPNYYVLDFPVALFGNKQIFLLKQNNLKQFNQIRTLSINQDYENTKSLPLLIAQQTQHLFKHKKAQIPFQQTATKYINRILKHIINDSDQQTSIDLQHKILYLSFKYILTLINKSAADKQILMSKQTTLQDWLVDLHLLFYNERETSRMQVQFEDREEKIFNLIKHRNYQQILQILNELLSSTKSIPYKKIVSFNIRLIISRIQQQDLQDKKKNFCKTFSKFSQLKAINHQVFLMNKQQLQNLKKSISQQWKKQFKKQFDLAQILVGNQKVIFQHFKQSWPLLLSFIIQSQKQQKFSFKREIIQNIYKQKFPLNTPALNYFFDLMEDRNFHGVYQSLFDLVNPFYSHLLGFYLYNFSEEFPKISILQQDYHMDIARNLLEHSSQIDYKCLFTTIKYLEQNQIDNIGYQMFEPLLYHHLHVIDIENIEQVSQFLQKLDYLHSYNLSHYGFQFAVNLLSQFFKNQTLNACLILLYIKMVMMYPHYYFENNLVDLADAVYAKGNFTDFDYQNIIRIKQNFFKNSNSHQIQVFRYVEDIFCRVFKIFEIKQTLDDKISLKCVLQLVKQTQNSILLLELIHQILQQIHSRNQTSLCCDQQERDFLLEIRQMMKFYKPFYKGQKALCQQIIQKLSILLDQELRTV